MIWEWCEDILCEQIDGLPDDGAPYVSTSDNTVFTGAVHLPAVPGDFAARTVTGKFQTLEMVM
jgi:hypothetical protein